MDEETLKTMSVSDLLAYHQKLKDKGQALNEKISLTEKIAAERTRQADCRNELPHTFTTTTTEDGSGEVVDEGKYRMTFNENRLQLFEQQAQIPKFCDFLRGLITHMENIQKALKDPQYKKLVRRSTWRLLDTARGMRRDTNGKERERLVTVAVMMEAHINGLIVNHPDLLSGLDEEFGESRTATLRATNSKTGNPKIAKATISKDNSNGGGESSVAGSGVPPAETEPEAALTPAGPQESSSLIPDLPHDDEEDADDDGEDTDDDEEDTDEDIADPPDPADQALDAFWNLTSAQEFWNAYDKGERDFGDLKDDRLVQRISTGWEEENDASPGQGPPLNVLRAAWKNSARAKMIPCTESEDFLVWMAEQTGGCRGGLQVMEDPSLEEREEEAKRQAALRDKGAKRSIEETRQLSEGRRHLRELTSPEMVAVAKAISARQKWLADRRASRLADK